MAHIQGENSRTEFTIEKIGQVKAKEQQEEKRRNPCRFSFLTKKNVNFSRWTGYDHVFNQEKWKY